MELSESQKVRIAREMNKKVPMETLGIAALINLAKIGIETEADEVSLTTNATFDKKRYLCKMLVTYEEIEE